MYTSNTILLQHAPFSNLEQPHHSKPDFLTILTDGISSQVVVSCADPTIMPIITTTSGFGQDISIQQ